MRLFFITAAMDCLLSARLFIFRRSFGARLLCATAVVCALLGAGLTSGLAVGLAMVGDGALHGAEARGKAKAHHRHSRRVHHVRHKSSHRRSGRRTKPLKAGTSTGLPIPAAAIAAQPKFTLLSRAAILASDPARLERLGRHLIVGYHRLSDVSALVSKRAIAGIFITDHNVRRRTVAAIKADIDSLQAIRAMQGLPPLIVAADQEGGGVSRLSPPLKRQTSLARVLAGLKDDAARKAAVEAYADTQANELRRLGVTLNFAPVVDLKTDLKNRRDGETRLRTRAIDSDPARVAEVAGWYCERMIKAGIMCTLKHFPGLGRVRRDTHVAAGEITAPTADLESKDWVPFRRVMKHAGATVMLGHVRIAAIDKTTPASFSGAVIQNLVRRQWGYDGILITDDLSMGAVTRSPEGAGGAAVKALDASVDLLLVSYLERHFDTVMSALIAADTEGRFDKTVGAKSSARIARVLRETLEPVE